MADMSEPLSDSWNRVAGQWIEWATTPGHDSYWQFHRQRFLELVPDPGELTLDVGCGEGRVGRDLTEAGHRVVGIDASPTMVRACVHHPTGHAAAVGDAMRLPVRAGVADLVVAFMSFHDVDDLTATVGEAARVLRVGGRLHIAIVHPINSAGACATGADPSPFVIDDAYTESRRYSDEVERDGLTMEFCSLHRPLAAYASELAGAGFVIETLDEVTDPDPTDKWSRIPLFLHLIARLDRR